MNGKVRVYPDKGMWIARDDDEVLASAIIEDVALKAGMSAQKLLKQGCPHEFVIPTTGKCHRCGEQVIQTI